ncbi:hypothetical protein [Streptomyces sp. NPDC050856]|uniref:hypothetical protein n=1 Tax=Streptomyces sp. NPDC050856 TaxID=3154939 RepID=UPI003403807E
MYIESTARAVAMRSSAWSSAPHAAPTSGGTAADRITDALGTPNRTIHGQKANVTAFVVRRFVDRGLLVDL